MALASVELALGHRDVPEFRSPRRRVHRLREPKHRSIENSGSVVIDRVCGPDGMIDETTGRHRHTLVTFPSHPSVVVEHRPGRTPHVRLTGTLYPGPSA